MKNLFLYSLLISLLAIPLDAFSQCDLPSTYEGNTGANMTIVLTQALISSLNVTEENAYLVALSSGGLVVGSTLVGSTLTTIAVWGDDSQTPEIDGALANELISFQLVNGLDLYDVVMPVTVSHVTNGLVVEPSAAAVTFICSSANYTILGCTDYYAINYNDLATEDDGSCIYPILGCMDSTADNYNAAATENDGSCAYTILGCTDSDALNYNSFATADDDSCEYESMGENNCELPSPFEGNTGSNMTLVLTSDFMSIQSMLDSFSYIIALSSEGEVIGSTDQPTYEWQATTTLPIWGDDAITAEIDGALDNELISFQLVNGTDLYDLDMLSNVLYFTNSMVVNTLEPTLTLNCSMIVYGCMDVTANNYDSSATDDDNSCEYESTGENNCVLPSPFEGNTGSNMTVMLSETFINSLPINDVNSYIVALTQEELVVGSQALYGANQTHITIWGDDASTIELDGALADELISFELVNDEDLYTVLVPSQVNYTTNDLIFQVSAAALAAVDCGFSPVLGCMDVTANNYNVEATEDDDSCTYTIFGCMDTTANNYDASATDDDESCIYTIFGCMDPSADNYNTEATEDDGSCAYTILGCTDTDALNYNSLATADDGSCEYDQTAEGDCILPFLFNGNTGSNMTVMLITDFVSSLNVTYPNAYMVALNTDGLVVGSTNLFGVSQTSLAVWGDDSQTPEIDGAQANELISFQLVNGTDLYNVEMPVTVNYTTNGLVAQVDPAILTSVNCGCTEYWADNYDELATISDGSCFKLGCMDSTADNYNTTVTEDDGSCTYTILGCTEDWADNYDELATENDGSCFKLGCTEDWADNYDVLATDNDGSCSKVGCTEDWADNFDPNATNPSSQIPEHFYGNTGVNMTALLTEPFINSLNITEENAYIVALNTNGLIVGSVNLGAAYLQNGQSSIAIWGNDSQTSEIDGAFANESISFQLVNGTDLYNVELPVSINYSTNGMSLQTSAAILTSATGDDCIRLGCTSDWADNYDSLATEDDDSCSKLGCTSDWADNYDVLATEDDGLCSKIGCTEDWADNYDVLSTDNDGSCSKLGCTEDWADNYDVLATDNDGSCSKVGCTEEWADNFDVLATENDGSCSKLGCTSDWADNYDALATDNDGSCSKLGCTEDWADNYEVLATDNDGSCSKVGCTSEWADNFDPFATNSSSQIPEQFNGNTGANMTVFLTEPFINSLNITEENAYIVALNTNGLVVGSESVFGVTQAAIAIWGDDTITPEIDGALANESISFQLVNGIDVYDLEMSSPVSLSINGMSLQTSQAILTLATGDDCIRLGCTSDWADNFDSLATEDDESCSKLGCTADWADNYDAIATEDDGSCSKLGCTEDWADNYDVFATENDGSCSKVGCTEDWADNYDALATENDGSCSKLGCTSDWADNFDALATDNDGSCSKVGCTEDWADNYDELATDNDGSCSKLGCKDISDCNFDALATIDDGSCIGQPGCLDHFYLEYNPLAGCSLENACQTSWIQLYDSLQVAYINLNETYLDSISQITQSYNSLDAECTQEMIQSSFAIDSLNYVNGSYIDSINQITINYNSLEEESAEDMLQSGLTIDSLNYLSVSLSEEVEYWSSPIVIDLTPGWNMIGYTSKEPQDVVATLQDIEDVIVLVKNNAAEVYWVEFGFNGIGDFIPGQGYQFQVSEGYIGFTYPDVGGERIELTPTVPMWAIDMEVEMHPNDIRTLVRVVNMLGQEVNPATQFNGEVLLYLYNDGTVEKKIVE